MVNIFLSINNNAEVIQLPVIPEDLDTKSPWQNDEFDGMKQKLNLIGLRGFKTLEINAFFPVRDYPFLRSRDLYGMEYVDTVERWRDLRIPMRLIVTNTIPTGWKANMAVTMDDFSYRTGKDGDIYYIMSLKEFPFVQVS